MPFDTTRDLAGVTLMTAIQIALVAFPGTPFNTMAELIAYARRNPGETQFRDTRRGRYLASRRRIAQAHRRHRRSGRWENVFAARHQLWHSDSSFQQPVARYSTLFSVINPPQGGETEFADLRAAYDALPEDLKRDIADFRSEHYALHSRINLGDTSWTEEQKTPRHRSNGRWCARIPARAENCCGWEYTPRV